MTTTIIIAINNNTTAATTTPIISPTLTPSFSLPIESKENIKIMWQSSICPIQLYVFTYYIASYALIIYLKNKLPYLSV